MEEVGTFYGHLVYFPDISYNLVHLLLIWYSFGKYYREKSGNPAKFRHLGDFNCYFYIFICTVLERFDWWFLKQVRCLGSIDDCSPEKNFLVVKLRQWKHVCSSHVLECWLHRDVFRIRNFFLTNLIICEKQLSQTFQAFVRDSKMSAIKIELLVLLNFSTSYVIVIQVYK
jgi:hypothetical protein